MITNVVVLPVIWPRMLLCDNTIGMLSVDFDLLGFFFNRSMSFTYMYVKVYIF